MSLPFFSLYGGSMYDKKDLELVKKTFEILNKAKWDGVDGDFMISSTHVFVGLKKLEDKIKQGLEAKPAPAPEQAPVEEKKKRGK